MSKYKGKREQKEDSQKSGLTNTLKVVWFILINAVGWIWCSYLLAFMGKEQIAETLSSNAVTSIIAVVLGYCGKALAENISKYNPFFNRKKESVEEPTPIEDDCDNSSKG